MLSNVLMAYDRRFNLNLLPIRNALVNRCSATRAGERRDLCQLAASAAIVQPVLHKILPVAAARLKGRNICS